MYKGTTPTFVFVLDSPLDLTNIDQVWITIRDGAGIKHNWDITRVELDNTKKTVELYLTQEETLEMAPGLGAVQIRFLTGDGAAFTTQREMVKISATLRGGVIE